MAETSIHKAINNLIEERIKLLEKEAELRKEAGQSDHEFLQQKDRLEGVQKKVNDAFEWGRRTIEKYAASLTTAALAHRAYRIATTSSASATQQFLLTTQSINTASTSYESVAKRAREYQKVVQQDVRMARLYGIEVENIRRVSDEWMKTQRFLGGINRKQQGEIKRLTDATIRYAKVMGVDGTELVKQASTRMFQYGESADHAMKSLLDVYGAARNVNAELQRLGSDKAMLWGDDFARIVEEASTRTHGFTQNLGNLSAAMAYSVKQANLAKQSYNATLEAGKAMGQFITGGDEDAMTMNVGLRMLDRLKAAIEPGGELAKEFLQDFTETQQAELQKVAGMVATTNARDLGLQLADTLATSKMGIEELLKLTKELGSSTGDIVPILMNMRHLSRGQAIELARQLKDASSVEEVMRGITAQYEGQQKETQKITDNVEGMTALIRAEGGKVTTIPILDRALVPIDRIIGDISAHFEDFGNVSKYALVAGVLAAGQFIKTFISIRGAVSGVLPKLQAAAVATQQMALGAAEYSAAMRTSAAPGAVGKGATPATAVVPAVTSGMQRALAPFSAGTALRVVGMGGPGATSGKVPPIVAGTSPESKAHAPTVVGAPPATTDAPPSKSPGRVRRAMTNPLTMLAAYMAGDYMLSPDSAADPESGKEKAKGIGRKGLSAAMIWAMLGMPGKAALGGLGAKAVGLGGSALGAMSGIFGGGSGGAAASGAAGTGAVGGAAGAGAILAPAAIGMVTAGTMLAPVMMAARAGGMKKGLIKLSQLLGHPLSEVDFGKGQYSGAVQYLAEDPGLTKQLHTQNVISDEMFRHTQLLTSLSSRGMDPTTEAAWREMIKLDKQPKTDVPIEAYQSTRSSVARPLDRASGQNLTSTITGGRGVGKVTGVNSNGMATVTVPMQLEIEGALSIPAEYDRLKSTRGG